MATRKVPTKAQATILRFRPTPQTWECRASVLRSVLGQIQTGTCGIVNAGDSLKCWCCGKRKPAKPKLLWPTYVKACAVVGIEPGTSWPVRETPTATATPKKPARRKGVRK